MMNHPRKYLTTRLQRLSILAIAIAFGAVECSAQGLTFVDASEFFNLSPLSAFNPGGSSTPVGGIGDNLWGYRGTFGAVGEIYEASGGTSNTATGGREDAPQITQTISGLAPGSYDIYVAYWASTSAGEDWNVRAGVQGGALSLFNRNGPQTNPLATNFNAMQDAIAGTLASGAIWANPPLDLTSSPIFSEGNRQLLLGKVGTATSVGGQIEVQIDDLSTADFPELTAPSYRTWFDGVAYAAAGTVIGPELSIDRGSGAVELLNNTGANLEIVSYALTSPIGGLDPGAWSPITGNLDNGGGFDVDAWQINSQTTTELSEQEMTIGDGGSLSGTSLGLGNAWIPSPYEDVQIQLTLADSRVLTLSAQYTGSAIALGDFDGSGGNPNAADFAIMMSNMHTSIAATSAVESHPLGDITGDLVVNFDDYRAFRAAFEAVNGAGSFASIGSAVPEPSSVVLLGLIGFVAATIYVKRRPLAALRTLAAGIAVCVATAGDKATAQITYVDATLANTDIAIGGPDSLWASGDDGSTGGTVADGVDLNDGLWRYRSTFVAAGAGQGVWEATGSSAQAEDAVEIVTAATGLENGFYRAYVFWHPVEPMGSSSGGNEEFPIRAGFTSNPNANQIFTQVNSEFVQGVVGRRALNDPDELTFSNPLEVPGETSTRRLLYGEIGITQVTNGMLPIFVDDLPANPGPEGYGTTLSDLRPWYQGIGYAPAIELSLEVNPVTGAARVANNQTGIDFELSYYEIRSASGSLNTSGWVSFAEAEDGLQHPAPDGIGWDEAAGFSSNLISEGRLQGTNSYMPGQTDSLGSLFTPGGALDLRFFYAGPDGALTEGIIEYINDSIAGDFNSDGFIDAADYTVWRDTLGDTGPGLAADANGDGIVDAVDYGIWRSNFGASQVSGNSVANPAAVPEPATVVAMVCLAMLVGGVQRRVAIA